VRLRWQKRRTQRQRAGPGKVSQLCSEPLPQSFPSEKLEQSIKGSGYCHPRSSALAVTAGDPAALPGIS
jgi:hypothetical protein